MQSPREKRKVGRPIIYSGDPDAPDLTPQERRRIRRRIANRESARRVRAKRQDLIEEMSIKVGTLNQLTPACMSVHHWLMLFYSLLATLLKRIGLHICRMTSVMHQSACIVFQSCMPGRWGFENARLPGCHKMGTRPQVRSVLIAPAVSILL